MKAPYVPGCMVRWNLITDRANALGIIIAVERLSINYTKLTILWNRPMPWPIEYRRQSEGMLGKKSALGTWFENEVVLELRNHPGGANPPITV